MRIAPNHLVLLVLLGTTFAAGGCRISYAWRDAPGDFPWGGPGEQLGAQSRTFVWFPFPAGGVQSRWVDSTGRTYDPHKVAAKAAGYLRETGAADGWPEVPSRVEKDRNGRKDRLAPFRFSIVSVRPTVVVMRPSDPPAPGAIPPVTVEASGELLGSPALWEPGLANGFEYVTTFPHRPGLWWFSPDLRQPPTPLAGEADTEADIPLTRGRLHLRASDGLWHVTRH